MKISYEKLFTLMKERGLTKTELTNLAGISTNQMAKLGKGESVQLIVLYKICKALACELCDVVTFY